MDFQDLINRALTIRNVYADFEKESCGKAWTSEQIALGLEKAFLSNMNDLERSLSI
jgi:hypothetical protein